MAEEMHSCMKDAVSFFNQVSKVAQRCMDSVLAEQPRCHFHILHRLAVAIAANGQDGSIAVSELATLLYNSPQAVSRGLRILEQDGLVERCTDPADRRKTTVRLTPQGQQDHDACEAAMQAYGAAVAARLGHERLHQMGEDFHALLEAMEACVPPNTKNLPDSFGEE